MISVLAPESRGDFPWPANIAAISTTRVGGVSAPPWDSLNLSDRVGDVPDAVARNCAKLIEHAELPTQPAWLWQVHGKTVIRDPCGTADPPEADAAVTCKRGCVLAIQTADCLPVVLTTLTGSEVAVAHAGWRGLAANVLAATVGSFSAAPSELLAWLGPCIGASVYEIDAVVRDGLLRVLPESEVDSHCVSSRPGHWLLDLAGVAQAQLRSLGVGHAQRTQACTYSEPARFFSFRRSAQTGRQATLAWIP